MTRITSPAFSGTFKFDFMVSNHRDSFAQQLAKDIKVTVDTIDNSSFNNGNYSMDVVVPAGQDEKIFPHLKQCIAHLQENPTDEVLISFEHDEVKVKPNLQDYLQRNCDVQEINVKRPEDYEHLPNVLNNTLRFFKINTQTGTMASKESFVAIAKSEALLNLNS